MMQRSGRVGASGRLSGQRRAWTLQAVSDCCTRCRPPAGLCCSSLCQKACPGRSQQSLLPLAGPDSLPVIDRRSLSATAATVSRHKLLQSSGGLTFAFESQLSGGQFILCSSGGIRLLGPKCTVTYLGQKGGDEQHAQSCRHAACENHQVPSRSQFKGTIWVDRQVRLGSAFWNAPRAIMLRHERRL